MRYQDSALIVIPEEAVRQAASYIGTDENSFTEVLDRVSVYKEADMTPVILMNPIDMSVYVVALETYNKKLN
jgi:hypothetical protein